MFYNQNRPHTALDDKTPNEFYFDNLPAMQKTVQSSEATSDYSICQLMLKDSDSHKNP